MTAPIIPGAEPFSADGGPHGALVLHGFTGHCNSVKGIARAFAAAGWAVECPLLPGHGTAIEDMMDTSWADWSAAAEAAYQRLAPRVERMVVVGLSMGGTLTCSTVIRHPEVVGIACINPVIEPVGELRGTLDAAVAEGQELLPGIGSDIADPDAFETSYAGTPLRALATLLDAVDAMQPDLATITCPVLILTSPNDHVVTPSNSDHLAARVAGPVERVTLERSYHVATLDYDKDLIVERVLDFAANVTPA